MTTTTIKLPAFPSFSLDAVPRAAVEGLYVHIPFCFHKCHYCDFYSITRQSPERMTRFVDLALREAEMWARRRVGQIPTPRTIFFGGGTPSLLPPHEMRRLIRELRERFDLAGVQEWTVECNPATVRESYGREYLQMLREAGVDRLSFGAQSFDKKELALLERHHDPADVAASLQTGRDAGFIRLNVDLIYAIPGQDLASWASSLDQAMALGTTHLSAYNLTYEPNTPMAVRQRLGQLKEVEESTELQMFHRTRRRLAQAGLQAYEVSNYATPGQECRHNLVYWTGGNYLALGPAGASHVEGWRWKNRPHLGEWEEAIERDTLPAGDVERLTPGQRAGELAMLRLRLASGLAFDDFTRRTGWDARVVFGPTIERIENLGLIRVDDDAVRLTEKGLNVADAVAGEFLSDAPD